MDNISDYIEELKRTQKAFLDFFNDEGNLEEKYQNLINYFDNINIKSNSFKLKEVLHLLSRISENHHRSSSFINEIEKVLLYFKEDIQSYYSNIEIFNIFKKNKRILLFLLENYLLKIDDYVSYKMRTKNFYLFYFFKEMKDFIEEKERERIEKIIFKINENDSEAFEKKRKIGENDSLICELIRNDSVDEFIVHVNQTNTSLSTEIESSYFETNSFLIKNKANLIEYAAFYGSIKIFRYLYFTNNNLLKSSLWPFVIHGKNPELIHLLEENNVQPENQDYLNCFIESIKCHHIDISNYILDNYLHDLKEYEKIYFNCFKYHNYVNFPKEICSNNIMNLCCFDYVKIVEILSKSQKLEMKKINENIFIFTFKWCFYNLNFMKLNIFLNEIFFI